MLHVLISSRMTLMMRTKEPVVSIPVVKVVVNPGHIFAMRKSGSSCLYINYIPRISKMPWNL